MRARPHMKEITLIRHAESQANLDGIWNGQVDGPLSAAGEASLDAIGKRLHEREFDVVVCSPLERAAAPPPPSPVTSRSGTTS